MKKIIVILALVVVVGIVLFAQDVIIKERNGSKEPDVYGHVYKWDGHMYVPIDSNPPATIHVSYFGNEADYYNDPYTPFFEQWDHTNGNGYYTINFPYIYHNAYDGFLKVTCSYENFYKEKLVDYSVSVQVDFYLRDPNDPYPTPDNTMPAVY